jgi:hypothetical protein
MSWQDFENEATEDLIELIRWKKNPEDVKVAEDAFSAFCFRFQKDITHKSRVIAAKWGYDKHVGDIIAERTFKRYWKYGNFDKTESNATEIDTGVKLYLYKIALRELTNYKNEQSVDLNPYTGDEEIVKEFPSIDISHIPIEKRAELKRIQGIIEKALERLTRKHKVIYLTYKAHQQEGHTLPRGLLKKLRDELDIVQASIQVYKKEAYDTVDEYLKLYGAR